MAPYDEGCCYEFTFSELEKLTEGENVLKTV